MAEVYSKKKHAYWTSSQQKLKPHARVCDENKETMTAHNLFALKNVKFDRESKSL